MKHLMILALLTTLLDVSSLAVAAETKHEHGAAPAATAGAMIAATGIVKSVDAAKGKLVIDHDPIPTLHWPRMVMDFQLANPAMAGRVKAGDPIRFEMQEGEKGAYLITSLEPAHTH